MTLEFLISVFVVLVIAFVWIMVYNIKNTKRALKDRKEINETLPKF